MEKNLFVIVHENCIALDRALYAEGKDPGLTRKEDYDDVCLELERIKTEEIFREVSGDPAKVTYPIPKDTLQIWVCGAYGDVCVNAHVAALKEQLPHMSVGIHTPGTISFDF